MRGTRWANQCAHSPEELRDPGTAPIGAIDPLDLKRAMAQLPPGFSQVFSLHDVEGYAHREIARKLGITEGTSKSQLHKARLRLRELLSGAASRQPQDEVGRVKRNVAPKAPAGMRNPKSLPPALNPERTLLPVPDARRRAPKRSTPASAASGRAGNDEFQCAEVSYGKSECA